MPRATFAKTELEQLSDEQLEEIARGVGGYSVIDYGKLAEELLAFRKAGRP